MAWNDQGGRDPWGGGNQQPPDLDEAFRKLKEKLTGGGSGGGSGKPRPSSGAPLLIGLLVLAGFWFWQGIYVLDEQERGVVLRLGQYHDTIMPGFNWQPAMIDTVFVDNVTQERQYSPALGQNLMLTRDENIVDVPLTVQYNIRDIKDYYLNISDPDATLEQATDSAVRHVVGSADLNNVISAGRELLREEVEVRLQTYLDNYGTGIHVIDVTMQEARPPEAVKQAFDDVIAASADKERLINEAQAYRNQILPQARGEAQRAIENANGYQGELIARAEGEADRFKQLLVEYSLAPEVTRERLYLDTVETVMSNANKVLVDVEGGNNMMYLPLDQLTRGVAGGGGTGMTAEQARQLVQETMNQLRTGTPTSTNTSTTRTLR